MQHANRRLRITCYVSATAALVVIFLKCTAKTNVVGQLVQGGPPSAANSHSVDTGHRVVEDFLQDPAIIPALLDQERKPSDGVWGRQLPLISPDPRHYPKGYVTVDKERNRIVGSAIPRPEWTYTPELLPFHQLINVLSGFVRRWFPEFDPGNREIRFRLLFDDIEASGTLAFLFNESKEGIYTGRELRVDLACYSGKVASFSADLRMPTLPLQPRLTKEDVVRSALACLQGHERTKLFPQNQWQTSRVSCGHGREAGRECVGWLVEMTLVGREHESALKMATVHVDDSNGAARLINFGPVLRQSLQSFESIPKTYPKIHDHREIMDIQPMWLTETTIAFVSRRQHLSRPWWRTPAWAIFAVDTNSQVVTCLDPLLLSPRWFGEVVTDFDGQYLFYLTDDRIPVARNVQTGKLSRTELCKSRSVKCSLLAVRSIPGEVVVGVYSEGGSVLRMSKINEELQLEASRPCPFPKGAPFAFAKNGLIWCVNDKDRARLYLHDGTTSRETTVLNHKVVQLSTARVSGMICAVGDGKLSVTDANGVVIKQCGLADMERKAGIDIEERAMQAAISPTGIRIAFSASPHGQKFRYLYLLDLEGFEVTQLTPTENDYPEAYVFPQTGINAYDRVPDEVREFGAMKAR